MSQRRGETQHALMDLANVRLGFVRKHKIRQEWRRRHTSRRIEHPSPCTFVPLKQDPIKWSPSLVASFGSRVLLEALLSLDLSLARTSSITTLKPATRSESRTTCSGCHTFMPAKRAAANIDCGAYRNGLHRLCSKAVQKQANRNDKLLVAHLEPTCSSPR